MKKHLEKLLSISSSSLCDSKAIGLKRIQGVARDLTMDLTYMLSVKNGFYAFESALHVLPSNCASPIMDVERWNSHKLWKHEYSDKLAKCYFFAEDVFGEQFGLHESDLVRFDPETAEIEVFAKNLNNWAEKLLENYEVEAGYTLASKWQEINGPLSQGQRLIPKIPFILGGEYSVDNLHSLDSLEAMRYRADIWRQIKDLPKGTKVNLRITGLQ